MNKSKLYLVFVLCVLATVVAYLTVSGNAGYTAGYSTDEEKAGLLPKTVNAAGLLSETGNMAGLMSETENADSHMPEAENAAGLLSETGNMAGLMSETENADSHMPEAENTAGLLTGTGNAAGLPPEIEGETGLPLEMEGETDLLPEMEGETDLLPEMEGESGHLPKAEYVASLPEEKAAVRPEGTQKKTEISISPGDDIQAAVDMLEDGGRLILNEGTYNTLEAIVLEGRKSLTIEGRGEVWIDTKGIDHHVMTLRGCTDITLANIRAQHVILEEGDNGPISNARDGAVIGAIGGAGIRLVGCELVGCGIYGLYADSVKSVFLEGCYLHDNSQYALMLETGAGSMHVTIRDCMITHNAGAIETRGNVDIKKEENNIIEQNSSEYYRN
jgi:hypothetical protein